MNAGSIWHCLLMFSQMTHQTSPLRDTIFHINYVETSLLWMLMDSNSSFLIACFNCRCWTQILPQSGGWWLSSQVSQKLASSMRMAIFFKLSLKQSLNLNLGLHGWRFPVENSSFQTTHKVKCLKRRNLYLHSLYL